MQQGHFDLEYRRLAISLLNKGCDKKFILDEQQAKDWKSLAGGEIVIIFRNKKYQFGYVYQDPNETSSTYKVVVCMDNQCQFVCK